MYTYASSILQCTLEQYSTRQFLLVESSVLIGVPLLYPSNAWRSGRMSQAYAILRTIIDCQNDYTNRSRCTNQIHSKAFLDRVDRVYFPAGGREYTGSLALI